MIRSVTAAVDDMFFASKIRATAKALGMIVTFPRNQSALLAAVKDDVPNMIIVDLHNKNLNPIDLASQLKSDEALQKIPLLGFFSHVNTGMQREAVQAGFDQVFPNSLFFRELANILAGERYNKLIGGRS